MTCTLAVIVKSPQQEAVVKKLLDLASTQINPANLTKFDYVLYMEDPLKLIDKDGRKLIIDPVSDTINYQRKHRGKNEMIAKALGKHKGMSTVLDLSVGLGIDALFMSQLGFKVTGLERNPLLYFMLSEAFRKNSNSFHLIHNDALSFINAQNNRPWPFDAIYFDPMYPHKKKSALPKQEMVLFRNLVGDDMDAKEVLTAALETLRMGTQRVVVKRPLHAEPLLPNVHHQLEGKIVRYDVYI